MVGVDFDCPRRKIKAFSQYRYLYNPAELHRDISSNSLGNGAYEESDVSIHADPMTKEQLSNIIDVDRALILPYRQERGSEYIDFIKPNPPLQSLNTDNITGSWVGTFYDSADDDILGYSQIDIQVDPSNGEDSPGLAKNFTGRVENFTGLYDIVGTIDGTSIDFRMKLVEGQSFAEVDEGTTSTGRFDFESQTINGVFNCFPRRRFGWWLWHGLGMSPPKGEIGIFNFTRMKQQLPVPSSSDQCRFLELSLMVEIDKNHPRRRTPYVFQRLNSEDWVHLQQLRRSMAPGTARFLYFQARMEHYAVPIHHP
jgi:hypothetical protein